jgi:hypothetical protein
VWQCTFRSSLQSIIIENNHIKSESKPGKTEWTSQVQNTSQKPRSNVSSTTSWQFIYYNLDPTSCGLLVTFVFTDTG